MLYDWVCLFNKKITNFMCWAFWVTLTTMQVTRTRWFIVVGEERRKKDESKRMHVYGFASLLSFILRKNGCGLCLCCHASLAAQWARGLWIPPVFSPPFCFISPSLFLFFLKLLQWCRTDQKAITDLKFYQQTMQCVKSLTYSLEELDVIEFIN